MEAGQRGGGARGGRGGVGAGGGGAGCDESYMNFNEKKVNIGLITSNKGNCPDCF